MIITMLSRVSYAAPLPQTYQVPLGDDFVSIDSPMGDEKQSLKLVGGYAWANQARGDNSLAKNYANTNLRYQRRFGGKVAGLVVSGDTSIDSVVGEYSDIKSPRVSAGFTSRMNRGFGTSFRIGSVLPVFGSPAVTDGDLTVGLFRNSYGAAFSGGLLLTPGGQTEYKAKVGAYIGKRNLGLTLEAVQRFGIFKPAEVLIGGSYKTKKLIIAPAFGVGLNDQYGTPKYRALVSFSYRNQKKVKEIEEEVPEEDLEEDDLTDDPTTEEVQEEKVVLEKSESIKNSELKKPVAKSRAVKNKDVEKNKNSNNSLLAQSDNTNNNSGERQKKTLNNKGGQDMPTGEATNAYQSVDPTAGALAGDFSGLAQSTGGDSMLTVILALIAVVGGGAAWKFYRQHSEQKHEQKMAQMKMNAQAQGLNGAQPPPCQAANTKLEAEIKQIKSRLGTIDNKMSLNADFDGDFIERKVKKLERRITELEEGDS